MAIATGTALALGLAASAGSSVVGAKMKSNAAKKASKEQEKAAQESNRYYQQSMNQIGGLYAPYVNAGAAASNLRAKLTNPGPGARFASQGVPNVMPQTGFDPNRAVSRGGTFSQMGPQGPGGYGPPQGGGYGPPPQGPPQRQPPPGPPPGMRPQWYMPGPMNR